MEVAICIITYKRPQGLAGLLAALSKLTFSDHPPRLRVIVVDNDAEESAMGPCAACPNNIRAVLEYHTHKRRGIPFARNCAVARALPTADCIVFIDDDEEPDPGWLDELLRVRSAHRSPVVAGPVIPRFPPEVPEWIRKGGLFEHPRYRTGEELTTAGTCNLLIDAVVFKEMDQHFDESFGLRGGSDRHFLHRVRESGYRMVWADDAIVYEWVPPSRARAGWMLRRFYSNGTANSFAAIEFGRGGHRVLGVLGVLGNGLAFIGGGAILLPVAAVKGRAAGLRYLRYVAYGLGLLAGLLGRRPEHYRTIHGE